VSKSNYSLLASNNWKNPITGLRTLSRLVRRIVQSGGTAEKEKKKKLDDVANVLKHSGIM
jgi:hypothetical protein